MNPLFDRAIARGIDPKTLVMLERFEAATLKNPNDAQAYYSMGRWWHWKAEYAKALDHLNKAVQLDPTFSAALCARADLRATCPDPEYRDGAYAIDDATSALNLARAAGLLKNDWQHRMYLRIVAAAFAEAGDFAGALQVETELTNMAITKKTKLEGEQRMESYRVHKPIRLEKGLM